MKTRRNSKAKRATPSGIGRPNRSLADKAAALAASTYHLQKPQVVDRAEAHDPKTGVRLFLFRVVSSARANKPGRTVILNERGQPVEASRAMESLFERSILAPTISGGASPAPAPISIQPDTNVFTLNPGDTVDETITVTIPKNSAPAKADVYFLAD